MKYTSKAFAVIATGFIALLLAVLTPSCGVVQQAWEQVKAAEINLRYTDKDGNTYTEPINGKLDGTLDIQAAIDNLTAKVGELDGSLTVVSPAGETELADPKSSSK